MPKYSTVFWSGLLGVICTIGFKYLPKGFLKDLSAAVGLLAYAYAGSILLFHLVNKAKFIMDASAEFFERIVYNDTFNEMEIVRLDVERAHQISRMDFDQLLVYNAETAERIIDLDLRAEIVRYQGVELTPWWVDGYLNECMKRYPDLPSIRRLPNGSTEQRREETFIEIAQGLGWVRKRLGLSTVWIDGHTPEEAKGKFFVLGINPNKLKGSNE
jgi:hypothetical protein